MKRQRINLNGQILNDMRDFLKSTDIFVIGMPEGEGRERGAE